MEFFGAQNGLGNEAGINGINIAEIMNNPLLQQQLQNDPEFQKYLKAYESQLQQGNSPGQVGVIDAEGGILVQPNPAFVIKTQDLNNNQKVFINVLDSEYVEKPHLKNLPDQPNEQAIRVPLSVGPTVEDFDRSNKPCVTVDIVANPETVKECMESADYRNMVAQLCMSAVQNKYQIKIDPKFKLPKIKYKGGAVAYQRIKVKKESQIEEVSAQESNDISNELEKRHNRPEFDMNFYPISNDETWWEVDPSEKLAAYDLPCYKNIDNFTKEFKKRFNSESRKQVEKEEQETSEHNDVILSNKICVLSVYMPDIPKHFKGYETLAIKVSDEGCNISSSLRRGNELLYDPLSIWWPKMFNSSVARAHWDAEKASLIISLPTDVLIDFQVFTNDFTNSIF